MNPIINQVINNAYKEVGVREVGDNGGKRVLQYQGADTLAGGYYPWCASFIAWNLLTTLGKSLCDRVWLRSASCDSVLDWARRKDIDTTTPQPGYAGLVMASKYDATHIFLVTKLGENTIGTVEGNTNTNGSRNGNGVYARTRRRSSKLLYVAWPRLLPASATPMSEEVAPLKPRSPLDGAQMWALVGRDGKKITDVPIIDGRAVLPAWRWAKWFKQELGWHSGTQTVILDGRAILRQPLMFGGRAWLRVTDLVENTPGLNLKVEPGKLTLSW